MDTWVYFFSSRTCKSAFPVGAFGNYNEDNILTDFAEIVPSDYAPRNLLDETGFTRNKVNLSCFLIIYFRKCNKFGEKGGAGTVKKLVEIDGGPSPADITMT
ncbi:MAG: hypothetical protein ABSA06_06730 [Geobacteraceae bacterium]|jgi:hypothetical protein